MATYGGATVPDYLSGAIMGTTYAIISGEGAEYGIALAIPIGLLLTQMDILGRMCNPFFQHYADRCAEKGDYRGVERANLLGFLPWAMSRVIPVMVGLIFGEAVVNSINAFIPAWFMTGLKTAGAILPAMGMAILMRVPAAEEVLRLLYHRLCDACLRWLHVQRDGGGPSGAGPGGDPLFQDKRPGLRLRLWRKTACSESTMRR